jgi:DNA-binding CsgD family transcriptional regulator/tetratricopeptide (TPR) repeat protein
LESAPDGDPVLRVAALNALGEVQRDLGEHLEARAVFGEALNIAHANGDQRGEATALNGLAALADDSGDIAANKEFCETAIPIWRALGDHSGLSRAIEGLAWAEAGAKNMSVATDLMSKALSSARVAGNEGAIAHLLASLGNLLAEQQRFSEAIPYLEDGLEMAQRFGERDECLEIKTDLALLALELKDSEAARIRLVALLPLFREGGRKRDAVMVLECCALLATTRGNHDEALRLVATAAAIRDAMGIPMERDPRVFGSGPTFARTALIRLGRAAADRPAIWSLDEALDVAERIVNRPMDGVGRMGSIGLTPRERDVLRLLTDGQPDKVIARELSISRKTASNHVSAILAKLGAASRTEAATTALREGIV